MIRNERHALIVVGTSYKLAPAGSPADAVGCLTTVSGKDNTLIENLFNSIKYWNNVKIILEEREVEESNWNNKNIGKTKWTGKL